MLEFFPFDGFSVYVREGYFILGESAYSLVIVGSEYHLSVKEVENTNDKQLYIPSTNDISWWYHNSNTKLYRLKILILASFVKDFIGGNFLKFILWFCFYNFTYTCLAYWLSHPSSLYTLLSYHEFLYQVHDYWFCFVTYQYYSWSMWPWVEAIHQSWWAQKWIHS